MYDKNFNYYQRSIENAEVFADIDKDTSTFGNYKILVKVHIFGHREDRICLKSMV